MSLMVMLYNMEELLHFKYKGLFNPNDPKLTFDPIT